MTGVDPNLTRRLPHSPLILGRLDDRPPFFDIGPHQRAEHLGGLLLRAGKARSRGSTRRYRNAGSPQRRCRRIGLALAALRYGALPGLYAHWPRFGGRARSLQRIAVRLLCITHHPRVPSILVRHWTAAVSVARALSSSGFNTNSFSWTIMISSSSSAKKARFRIPREVHGIETR